MVISVLVVYDQFFLRIKRQQVIALTSGPIYEQIEPHEQTLATWHLWADGMA